MFCKLHNSVFVDSDGEKHDYKALCVKYAASAGVEFYEDDSPRLWALGKPRKVWKFASRRYFIKI